MIIYILDADRNIIGPVGEFSSFLWDREYYEPGTFELHAPTRYFETMAAGTWIYRNDTGEIGRIRSAEYVVTQKGAREASVKGYTADQILEERVINKQTTLTGTPEEIARKIVSLYCMQGERAIPGLSLGTLQGLGEEVTTQVTGETVGTWLHELEKAQEMSHRIIYDFAADELVFECYQGKDRTQNQAVNSWAVFSDQFANITEMNYRFDDSEGKNYAYIAGEGEGKDRTVVTVDIRTDPNAERREIFVDARDLQRTYRDDQGVDHTYTEEEYEQALIQRGLEKLTGFATVETMDASADPTANLIYKQDYDLGDLCTIRMTEIGLETDKRITGIRETYEGAAGTIEITFGQDTATSLIRVIRREAHI